VQLSHLFIVDPLHEHFRCSRSPFPFVELPVEHGNNNIVLHKRDQKLVWVDLRIHIIEEFGVKGDIFSSHIEKYKKNFLPIGGINN